MTKAVRVMIDPGHGGDDRWNRGPTGYIEADGVLKIAKYLKEELEATGRFVAGMTREGDRTLTLRERAMIGKDFNADLLISQHTNAFNGKARGAEVFYSVKRPKDKETAGRMAKALAKHFNTLNRGAKTRKNDFGNDFYGVIRESVNYKIPTVFLVESLFHDNPGEEAYLKKEKNLKVIAKIQAEEIMRHYGIKPMKSGESKGDVLYRVQTGAFRIRKNALRQEQKLLDLGYSTYLFQEGDLHKVQVGAYRVKKNAEKMRSKLKSEGFDAFIPGK